MELFAKIVNGSKPLTISVKSSILDVWQGSAYASEISPISEIFHNSLVCNLWWNRLISRIHAQFLNFPFAKKSIEPSANKKLTFFGKSLKWLHSCKYCRLENYTNLLFFYRRILWKKKMTFTINVFIAVDSCNPTPFWLEIIENFLEVTLFPMTIDVSSLT